MCWCQKTSQTPFFFLSWSGKSSIWVSAFLSNPKVEDATSGERKGVSVQPGSGDANVSQGDQTGVQGLGYCVSHRP